MSYYVPTGFARVQIDLAPAGARGSTPTFGFGASCAVGVELADAIEGWINTEYALRLGNNWAITGIRCYDNTNVLNRPLSISGPVSSAQMPPNIAALCSLSTVLRGRKNRGRIYFPGVLMDSDVNDDGSIQGTKVDGLQTMVDELRDALQSVGSGGDLTVLHTEELAPTDVIEARVQGVAATQRRRLRK